MEIRPRRKIRSLQRAKEQEIPLPYWSRLQKGETIESRRKSIILRDMVLGAMREKESN